MISRLENLIPPPVVLLFTLVAMFIISRFDHARILRADEFAINSLIATMLMVAGIASGIFAIKKFKNTQTTINPLRPHTASNLVTSGIFRFSRNPMYLGMVLVTLSSAAFYGSAWCLIAVAGFIVFIKVFQIGPEEKVMESLFGTEFDAYKANTRRWI